jgi:hypothetical protein
MSLAVQRNRTRNKRFKKQSGGLILLENFDGFMNEIVLYAPESLRNQMKDMYKAGSPEKFEFPSASGNKPWVFDKRNSAVYSKKLDDSKSLDIDLHTTVINTEELYKGLKEHRILKLDGKNLTDKLKKILTNWIPSVPIYNKNFITSVKYILKEYNRFGKIHSKGTAWAKFIERLGQINAFYDNYMKTPVRPKGTGDRFEWIPKEDDVRRAGLVEAAAAVLPVAAAAALPAVLPVALPVAALPAATAAVPEVSPATPESVVQNARPTLNFVAPFSPGPSEISSIAAPAAGAAVAPAVAPSAAGVGLVQYKVAAPGAPPASVLSPATVSPATPESQASAPSAVVAPAAAVVSAPESVTPEVSPAVAAPESPIHTTVTDSIKAHYEKNIKQILNKRDELGSEYLNSVEVLREYFAKAMCLTKYLPDDEISEYKTITDINKFNDKTKALYKTHVKDKGVKEFYSLVKEQELLKTLEELALSDITNKYVVEADLTSSNLSHIKTLRDISATLTAPVTAYLTNYHYSVYMNYLMCFTRDLDLLSA